MSTTTTTNTHYAHLPPQQQEGYQNAPPPRQTMTNTEPEDATGARFLANSEAVLVRQRLQVFEQFCNICEKQNMYHIANTTIANANREPPLTDDEFWTQEPLGFVREESTLCCRMCCGRNRELQFGMYVDEQRSRQPTQDGGLPPVDFMLVDRPFRCTILCPCCAFQPPEATAFSPDGLVLGKSELDWGCNRCYRFLCCGEINLAIKDPNDIVRYWFRPVLPTFCNGCRNCCAPTPCNKAFVGDILDATETTIVGNYQDTYPGYVGCRCCSDASNFALTFPQDATAIDKALILNTLFLTEMLIHEKPPPGSE